MRIGWFGRTVTQMRPIGNALDLWTHATGQSIYDAALDLCHRLHLPVPELPAPKPTPTIRNREEEPVDCVLTTCTIT